MSATFPVNYTRDADGIGWIVFDAPQSSANIFNPDALAAFATALDAAERDGPIALVITSAKEKIFIAGADLKWLAGLDSPENATALSRHGQNLFQRVAAFRVPVVAAIHGACAGGGFELALACHWRVATDSPATRIGLPETGIGTIPGWGGCVRLPRLIGVKPALDHILAAQLLPARDALEKGLVNEVVVPDELRARAKFIARQLATEGMPATPPPAAPAPEIFGEFRKTVAARSGRHLPALVAAIGAVEQTSQLPIASALEVEATLFGEVTVGPVCKNLLHVFFLREAARKRTLDAWFHQGAAPSSSKSGRTLPPPTRIGIVGAGVMGSGIAQWLAARGCEVVMRDVQPEVVERGLGVIRGLFDEAVKRGKLGAGEANSALARIRTTTAWEGFERCDVVIEAIVENVAAKQSLFRELAAVVRSDTLLASNTSALPIEEIAGHVPNPARTLGIHFFNPVSRMSLVELILGRQTSPEAAARALALVKALGKSPVICRSSPGFLVTRVLFFYLNEAVRLWEQGLTTAAIDDALRGFGWPMGPLRLIDEVGIDVTDFIFGEMAHYYPDRFTRATATSRLLAAGLRGRKNGASTGFYSHTPKEAPNDPRTREIAGRLGELTLPPDQITAQLMRVMSDEARRCLDEGVVKSADDIDFALLTGAGFPAWRGGLMRWKKGSEGVGE